LTGWTIRAAKPGDRPAIRSLLVEAFDGTAEAELVGRLAEEGAIVLELVADMAGRIVGHILFSRLMVSNDGTETPAVALAPLAVSSAHHGQGIGGALVDEGHRRLAASGERLSVVLGDPDYYARFGYRRDAAEGYDCDYQCDALQALAWRDDAPRTGRLVYASAFEGL
jgi:putative acetyltransferase